MKKRWVINTPPEATKIEELSKKLNCHPVIANLLLQRGITSSEQAQSFFYPSLNMLHDPFLMKDMDKAVERLDRAIAQDEKILIYGDYDVDGTTAVSLLYKYLKHHCNSDNLEYYIPDRYTEGYGVSIKGIDYAAENGFSLMLITDCGIKAVEKMPIPNRWISSFVTTILREIRCRKPLRCSIPNVRIVPTLTNG